MNNPEEPITLAASSPAGDDAFAKGLTVTAFVDKTTDYDKNNYAYWAFVDFTWTKQPVIRLTDTLAMAWDGQYKGIANTLSAHYMGMVNGQLVPSKTPIKGPNQDLYGIQSDFKMQSTGSQMGGIEQKIVTPKKNKGNIGKFQAKYIHNLVPPVLGSIAIKAASISVPSSWAYQEFVVNFNNKVGN